jgi:hypothetical protein
MKQVGLTVLTVLSDMEVPNRVDFILPSRTDWNEVQIPPLTGDAKTQRRLSRGDAADFTLYLLPFIIAQRRKDAKKIITQ